VHSEKVECVGGYCSIFACLCGHCKGREELIQLLAEFVRLFSKLQAYVPYSFGCFVVDDIIGIIWGQGVFLGNLGAVSGGAFCTGVFY